jgi:hypothetical protein
METADRQTRLSTRPSINSNALPITTLLPYVAFSPQSWRAIRSTHKGEIMKPSRTAKLASCATGASLLFGGFLLLSPISYAAQEQCSAAKLQGRYVVTGHGMNLHYGALDFDGAGKFRGKQTSLRHAVAQRENLSGTYTLDADCTGTLTLEGQLGGTAHWDVFVTQDGKKGRMIRTDSGATGVRTFEQ